MQTEKEKFCPMGQTNSGGKKVKTTIILSHVDIKMITFNINLPLFVLFWDYCRLSPQSKVTFNRLVLCLFDKRREETEISALRRKSSAEPDYLG